MSVIYFMRHGQASFGEENYDRLSDLGCRQSEILGDYFLDLGLRFDAVYSGTIERQTVTARIVMSRFPDEAARPPGQSWPEFNEYQSSEIIESQIPALIEEDATISDALERMYTDRRSFQRVFESAMLRWVSGRYDQPGVETWKAFSGRVRKGVRRIMTDNGRRKKIAVFISGGPISAALQMALGLDDETALRLNWQIRNTSVSTFKYDDEGIFLGSFNSVAHLEQQRDSGLLTYR